MKRESIFLTVTLVQAQKVDFSRKKTQEEKTQNSRIRHNFNFFLQLAKNYFTKVFFLKIFNGNHGILKYMKMRKSKLKVEFLSLLQSYNATVLPAVILTVNRIVSHSKPDIFYLNYKWRWFSAHFFVAWPPIFEIKVLDKAPHRWGSSFG